MACGLSLFMKDSGNSKACNIEWIIKMRLRLTSLVFMLSLLPVAANAQVITIDMNAVKCSQYLAMTPSASNKFSAWMSGWFSYKNDRTFVDLALHEKNIASVKDWCKFHQNASVMEGLKTTLGTK